MKCYTIREEAHKGINISNKSIMGETDPSLIIGAPSTMMQVPLGGDLRRVFQVAVDAGYDTLRLMRADIATQGVLRFIRERNQRDSRALVYVETESGGGGRLRLLSNSYEEYVDRGRVQRYYNFFPPTGVEVVAMGTSSSGCPHGLFIMSPGSSFRIERSGDLDDASPVLIVAWPGSTLRCFPPKKYQQAA